MAVVCRNTISSLELNMQNSIIIGIIIRSQNSHTIDASRSRFYTTEPKGVWNFTLRDSIEDFINVSVWGSVEYVNKLFTTFHIGSVVEVINAKVSAREVSDPKEVFIPSVTSPFTLTLNQGSSIMINHDTPAVPKYKKLLRIPTKNPAHAEKLDYILKNIEALKDTFFDVMVAVTFVSQVRELYTRSGELARIREFEITDDSISETVKLTLWDLEWIRLADDWKPMSTILFLADAQVYYNERMKKFNLTIARKTIITENPEVTQAVDLKNAMQEKPNTQPVSPYSLPNPNSITTRMTISEITNRINFAKNNGKEDRFQLLVIVRATVEDMNVDANDINVITSRCAKCKRVIQEGKDSCMNLECPFGSGLKSPQNVTSLNILAILKDDTGYLIGCRLRDEAAERALGCTAEELKKLSIDERIKLKGKFNKEVCDVRLQIIGATQISNRPLYNILAINVVSNEDSLFEPFDADMVDESYTT